MLQSEELLFPAQLAGTIETATLCVAPQLLAMKLVPVLSVPTVKNTLDRNSDAYYSFGENHFLPPHS